MADTRPKLLIVEDDTGLQRQLRWCYDEYQIFMAGDREEAIAILRAEAPTVVTLDLGLPPDPDGVTEGFATLTEILRIAPDTKVVIASGHGERQSARRSIALGAWDFYQKPIDLDSLRHIVARAFHVHRLEAENTRAVAPADNRVLGTLVTAAPEMMAIARTVERVAPTDLSVMLMGASGTGKGLVARALHDASPRRGGPFVTLNCAAMLGTMPEAAFADAAGGTLFLDEVGDIPPALQARLLSSLADRHDATEARIICATNR
ncbi:MAG: sigma 54-interacting transcriptional regulator, partial [Sphingobium sp.]